MDLIDLDEDTINTDVLNSLDFRMENLGTSALRLVPPTHALSAKLLSKYYYLGRGRWLREGYVGVAGICSVLLRSSILVVSTSSSPLEQAITSIDLQGCSQQVTSCS